MNRNTESHFATLPDADIHRSLFERSSSLKTTFNAGKLIPIYVDEVLPGDTFKMKTSTIIRMTTPVHPVMDNAVADIYYFFVPNRLVWEHWKQFMGENSNTAWAPTTTYTIPYTTSPSGGWNKGTIADYMGIPTKIANLKVNSLPLRAYGLIWNEWFRDQNTQYPTTVWMGDGATYGTNGSSTTQDIVSGGMPAPVNKFHDYFTSCLPSPAKTRTSVVLPLGTTAPVIGNGKAITITDGTNKANLSQSSSYGLVGYQQTSGLNVGDTIASDHLNQLLAAGKGFGLSTTAVETGMVADLSNATAATINQLRQAFQIQRLYEKDARGGTRYREIIKSHFGVTSPDGRQQIPEYLGGKRIPITMNQVVQTSSTDSTSAQGNTAAFSLTANIDESFTKSFTEHGYIIGLCCIRTMHTYQQGLEKLWSRENRFDFYWPALANLGEQAVLNKEIYAQGSGVTDSQGRIVDDQVFGYQEAWADYRYKPSKVTGAMRSNYTTSLDVWHYADKYTTLPTLALGFIPETTANIDRTLTVPSSTEDQFIADFYFNCECARPMPVYSIPGLIDHN